MTANVRMQAGAVLYKKGKGAKYFKQQPLKRLCINNMMKACARGRDPS